MTEEFLKRMQEANEKAIKVYKKTDKKYLAECDRNKKYVDLYLDLVLLFIEIYDYKKGLFNINSIESDLSEVIGNPESIYSYLDDDKQIATIHLHYKRNRDLKLDGLPDFISNNEINFNVVNEILSENGICVTSNLWDGGERGLDDYIINFDASIIIKTHELLQKESDEVKKRILTI
jgi:hypothetical protein